jgi:hypothetical protein
MTGKVTRCFRSRIQIQAMQKLLLSTIDGLLEKMAAALPACCFFIQLISCTCALRLWLKWILNFLCHFSLGYQEIKNTAKQETKQVGLSKLNKKTCLNEPQKPKNLHDGKCNQVL